MTVHEYLTTEPGSLGLDTEGLTCYVPFDEADGKHFTERVHSARGYFDPQEPYVNDDNELVFTGYQCMALPSLRATFETTTTYLTDTKSTDGRYLSEDGAYCGGILWDRGIHSISAGSDPDYTALAAGNQMLVLKGVAQMRIRLRQLKEGALCGRLGIVWNRTTETYQLMLVEELGTTQRIYYGGTVDEDWIGTEKTITVFFDGTLGADNACSMFVDDDEVSLTADDTMTWNNGTSPIDDTDYRLIEGIADNDSEPEDGALGGNVGVPEYCIAFDLVFFRQWWDDFHYGSEATFVSETYALEDLPDELVTMHRGLTATFNGDVGDSVSFDDLSDWPYDKYSNRGFVTLPFTKDIASAVGGYFGIDSDTDIIKTDIIVKRIIQWESSGNDGTILTAGDYNLKADFASWMNANGCTISNLVNHYNYKTFRDMRRPRTIFSESSKTNAPAAVTAQVKSLHIFETIEDASPLHGCEYIGGDASQSYLGYYNNKTRYLILCNGSRSITRYGQRSHRARWCTGPIAYAATDTMPIIRAIARYRSENGEVNKLFVVAGCSFYEINTSTGALTAQDYGWLSGTSVLSTALSNNKLLFMDPSAGGIKINGFGNWSRIGVERPVDIRVWQMRGIETDGNFDFSTQFAWVAQYYDSENDAYSGTIPVIKEQFQTMVFKDGGDGVVPDVVALYLGACRDGNVDGFRLYRTQDLKTSGIEEADLFLVCDSRNTNEYEKSLINDTATVTELPLNPKLSTIYFGQDMVPLPSPAIATAFNRVWAIGNSDADSLLRFSLVDSLGFAKVDEYPETNAIIIEEGGTAGGTALVEYAGQLLVFKDNAIFRVSWDGADFYQELIYKGVGALNQRCVLVAGQAVFFLDSNGLYVFQGGEPTMVSAGLLEFFKANVSATYLNRSFMLYSKEDEAILVFVPSTYSAGWCDLCVVYSMRTQTFTVDCVPPATCGFVDLDDNQIYMGTAYGAVLKYTRSTYLDQVSASDTATGEVDTAGDVTSISASIDATGRLPGTYVFAVDETNYRIWRGVISANTAATLSVEDWIPVFNATEDPLGTVSLYFGHILLYDKTPSLAFDPGEEPYQKNLVGIEWMANDFTPADVFYSKVDLNEGDKTSVAASTSTTVRAKRDVVNGAHRLFHVELGALVDSAFRIRNAAYFVVKSRGREIDG